MREGDKLPGLILFYSSIDIFASITRPVTLLDTNGSIFRNWVDAYMLPSPPLRCTSMDFWGARCGLLHTFTTESKKSREGHARELGYIDSDSKADDLQRADANCVKYVVVGIPSLMRAFSSAVSKFGRALESDAALRTRAEHHLKNFVSAENLSAGEIERIKNKAP